MATRTTNMPKRPIRQMSVQDKILAINRVHSGESKASVARDIGVPESTLRGWCKSEQKLRAMISPKGSPTSTNSSEDISLDLSVRRSDSDGPPAKRQRTSPLNSATPSLLSPSNMVIHPRSLHSVPASTTSPTMASTSPSMSFPQVPILPPVSLQNHVSLPAPIPISAPVAITGPAPRTPTVGLPVATTAPHNFNEQFWNLIKSSAAQIQNFNNYQLNKNLMEAAKMNMPPVPPLPLESTGWFLPWYRSTLDYKYTPTNNNNKLVSPSDKRQKENSALSANVNRGNLAANGRLILDNLVSNAENNNHNFGLNIKRTVEGEGTPSTSEAISHGENFLRWLESGTEPNVSVVHILQFRNILAKAKATKKKRGVQRPRKSKY